MKLSFNITLILAYATMVIADLFTSTCVDIGYQQALDSSNFILYASCKDEAGNPHQSFIDLNGCIANEGGNLVWAHNGRYDLTCVKCGFSWPSINGDLHFTCWCLDGHGGSTWGIPGGLSMDSGLGNSDGFLVC